jgi:lipopolysaccharide exporter
MDAKRVRESSRSRDPATEPAPVADATSRVSIRRGTAYVFAADLATAASAIAVSIGVTRLLVPAERGVYFLAVFAAGVIALVGDLGATIASLTYAAGERIPAQKLHGLALATTAFATLAGGAILIGVQPFWTHTVLKGVGRIDLTLATIGIAPLLYGQIGGGLLTGLGRVRQLSKARIIAAVCAPPIAIPAVWASHGSSRWAIAGWLGSAVVYGLGIGAVLFRAGLSARRPSWREFRELLGFGLRGQIGTVSHQGFLRLDVLFLSARSGPAVVGWYSLASVVAEKMALVGSAVYSASASRVGGLPRAESAALVARLIRAVLLVLVPAGVILAVFAHPLITTVFGGNYAAAAKPLQLLIPGTICLVLWYLTSLYIVTALRRPGLTTIIQLAAVAASIPLYYFAVKRYQMTGAAVASTLVYALVFVAGTVVFLRTSGIDARALRPRREDLRQLMALPSSLRRARA